MLKKKSEKREKTKKNIELKISSIYTCRKSVEIKKLCLNPKEVSNYSGRNFFLQRNMAFDSRCGHFVISVCLYIIEKKLNLLTRFFVSKYISIGFKM